MRFDAVHTVLAADARLLEAIKRRLWLMEQTVGLAILTDWFMRDDLTAGRLIPVLNEWMQPFPGVSLYYPANRHVPTALRLLIDLIHEVVSRESPRRREAAKKRLRTRRKPRSA